MQFTTEYLNKKETLISKLKSKKDYSYTFIKFKSFDTKYQYYYDVSPRIATMYDIRNQKGPQDIPPDYRIFALDFSPNTGSKCYTQKTLEEAYKFINIYPHLYESHGLKDYDIKIRFPIDLDVKHKIPILTLFFELFVEFWNVQFSDIPLTINEGFNVSMVANPNYPKVSLHAIVKDYYFPNIQCCKDVAQKFMNYFATNQYDKTHRKMVEDNIEHLKANGIIKSLDNFRSKSNTDQALFFMSAILGFDKSIYGNRFFRTIYSSKNKQIDNTLYPCDLRTLQCDKTTNFEAWRDHLATWIPETCKYINYEITNNEENNKIKVKNNKIKENNNIDQGLTLNPMSHSGILPPSHNVIQNIIDFLPDKYAINYDTWRDMGYILKNLYKNFGDRTFGIEDKEYIYSEQNIFKLFLNFSLKSPKADSPQELKNFLSNLKVHNDDEKELSLGTLFHWAKETILDLANSHQFTTDSKVKIYPQKAHQKYLQNPYHDLQLLPTNTIIIIQANPGTGKTTVMTKICQSLKNLDMIVLGYRRSLCAQLFKCLKEGDIKVGHYDPKYMDCACFYESDAKVVQLDSIGKLKMCKKYKKLKIYSYDIWFDEISGFLKYACTSTTFKTKSFDVITDLFQYIKQARNIICTDADVSQDELDFLRTIRPDMNVQIHTHQYVPQKECPVEFYIIPKYKFLKNGNEVLQNLITEIGKNDNIPVMFFSDSKTLADKIYGYIAKKYNKLNHNVNEFKYYTSEMGNLDDINQDLGGLWTNLIGFSPSITTGVDFTTPCKVFGFYTGNSLTPREFIQQGERARNKVMYQVVSLDSSTKASKIIYDFNNIKNQYIDEEGRMTKYLQSNGITNIHVLDPEYQKYYEAFTELTYKYKYKNQLEKAYPNDMLKKIYQNRGYRVNYHFQCPFYKELGSLEDIVTNHELLFKNMRRELTIHGEIMMNSKIEQVYGNMWVFIEDKYNISLDKWIPLTKSDKIYLLLDSGEVEWNMFKENNSEYFNLILEAIKKEKVLGEDPILWKTHKNKLGVLNFMGYAEKLYSGVKERCNILGYEVGEVLKDDFLWELVTSDANLEAHFSLRYMWKSEQNIKNLVKNECVNQRLQYLFGSPIIKYKLMTQLEHFLGIKDRFLVDQEFIFAKLRDNIILESNDEINNDFIMNICKCFDIPPKKYLFIKEMEGTYNQESCSFITKEKEEIGWLYLFKLLVNCWKRYFGNVIGVDILGWRQTNKVRFNDIPIPRFDQDMIAKHKHVYDQHNGVEHSGILFIDDEW